MQMEDFIASFTKADVEVNRKMLAYLPVKLFYKERILWQDKWNLDLKALYLDISGILWQRFWLRYVPLALHSLGRRLCSGAGFVVIQLLTANDFTLMELVHNYLVVILNGGSSPLLPLAFIAFGCSIKWHIGALSIHTLSSNSIRNIF